MRRIAKLISVCVSAALGLIAIRGLFYRLWDPDYTKLTFRERKRLERSEKEMSDGIYFTEEDLELEG